MGTEAQQKRNKVRKAAKLERQRKAVERRKQRRLAKKAGGEKKPE